MKKQTSLYRPVSMVALVTLLILSVPFIAMQYTNEVAWSAADFIIMAALLSATGLAYVLLTRASGNLVYRVASGFALAILLFMVWANLAVGLIGSGPNAGNLVYMAIVVIAIAGAVAVRFRATGMERVMYTASLLLVLFAVVAPAAGMDRYPGSSLREVLGVRGVFAGLFLAAGLLFRYAARANRGTEAGKVTIR